MNVKEEIEKDVLKFNTQKTTMASSPNTSWQIEEGKEVAVTRLLFSWAPKSLQTVTAATKLKDVCSLEVKL